MTFIRTILYRRNNIFCNLSLKSNKPDIDISLYSISTNNISRRNSYFVHKIYQQINNKNYTFFINKLTTQVYDRHLDLPHSDIELHWPKITTTTRSWRDIGYTASCCILKIKKTIIYRMRSRGKEISLSHCPQEKYSKWNCFLIKSEIQCSLLNICMYVMTIYLIKEK